MDLNFSFTLNLWGSPGTCRWRIFPSFFSFSQTSEEITSHWFCASLRSCRARFRLSNGPQRSTGWAPPRLELVGKKVLMGVFPFYEIVSSCKGCYGLNIDVSWNGACVFAFWASCCGPELKRWGMEGSTVMLAHLSCRNLRRQDAVEKSSHWGFSRKWCQSV